MTVQVFDRVFGAFGIRHFDKGKSATTSCLSVHDDVHSRHFAILFERATEFFFGGLEREVPDINVRH
jgi:hypothetical protein